MSRQGAAMVEGEEAAYMQAIDKSNAMAEFALDGTILHANKQFLDIMGYELADVVGRHHRMFLDAATIASEAYEVFWRNLSHGIFQTGEFRRLTKAGKPVWLQASYNPILDASGQPFKIVKCATDVTAGKVRSNEQTSKMAAISRSQAIAEFALDGTILDANEQFLKAVGYRREELVGANHRMLVEPGDRSSIGYKRFWAELRRGRYHAAEYRRVGKHGQMVWFQATYNPVLDYDGKPLKILKCATDVTCWKLKVASAEFDYLTGLPNRMLLHDRLTQAINTAMRRKTMVAVLFVDLDGFKHVNDSLGHLIGDKLLQSVAGRLVRSVRASDTVSRQGGDEFVVLLTDLRSPQDAVITAKKILAAVADAHQVDQHQLYVTASIGVSVYPQDGAEAQVLLKNADTAMYQVKQSGRDGYRYYDAAMNVKARERQFISDSLRYADERNELKLLYQPKIDIKTRRIIGAEALLRWTHPQRGAIEPARFIPVAEDCGLIPHISSWVMRETCEQARRWSQEGLAVPRLAVNISGLEFRNDDFLERLLKIVNDTGTDPHALEIELTESVLMQNPGVVAPILSHLRELGMQISLDDFGTGYSSLSYLTKFPIDTLKIDQSFVQQLGEPGQNAVIITAIISMARSLNLRVIAEGVETLAHLDLLRTYNCDEAQGYYFSHPVPPAAFGALLRDGLPLAA
jgi:diguanylate cyclase (GGDEF)-like protein/PAS domain S-box-containing protein